MMTTPAVAGAATVPTVSGYTLITSAGGVFGFGAAPALGSALSESSSPVVGIAPDSTGKGYWVATANGGVFSFGDAKFYGSLGNGKLKAPIVGIVPTGDGAGYYLVASDGGVFAFNSSVTSDTGSSSTLVTTELAGYFGSVPGELGPAGIAIPDNVVAIAPTL
jgi:hypothetical protein